MFKRILVPLDGSERAEQALPLAARLAQSTGGTLLLLHVMPPPASYKFASIYPDVSQELLRESQEDIKAYLAVVVSSQGLTTLTIHADVLAGMPTESILEYAQRQQADSIVLCSHGYTGLKRWALGSVAQKIARYSSVPVLILTEQGPGLLSPQRDEAHPLRALIGLDGSPFAETVLTPAMQLVSALTKPPAQGVLHLIRVVRPPTEREQRKYQVYDINIQEYNRREAEGYLHTAVSNLSAGLAADLGVQVTSSVIEGSDVASTLVRVAESGTTSATGEGYDLIALTTHGRGGIERWVLGSIAERLLQETKLPLLVIRPKANH